MVEAKIMHWVFGELTSGIFSVFNASEKKTVIILVDKSDVFVGDYDITGTISGKVAYDNVFMVFKDLEFEGNTFNIRAEIVSAIIRTMFRGVLHRFDEAMLVGKFGGNKL